MDSEVLVVVRRYFDALDRERSGRPLVMREVSEMYHHLELNRTLIEELYRRASGVLEQNQIPWCTTFDPLPCEDREYAQAVMREASARGYETVLQFEESSEVDPRAPLPLTLRSRIDPKDAYPLDGFREFERMALEIVSRFERVHVERLEHVVQLTLQDHGFVCLVTEDGYDMREPTLELFAARAGRYRSTRRVEQLDAEADACSWLAEYLGL